MHCSAFYGMNLKSQISNLYLNSLSQALFASICAYISAWPDQPSVSPAMAFISSSAARYDMVLENLSHRMLLLLLSATMSSKT
jgi:hypothetical protein